MKTCFFPPCKHTVFLTMQSKKLAQVHQLNVTNAGVNGETAWRSVTARPSFVIERLAEQLSATVSLAQASGFAHERLALPTGGCALSSWPTPLFNSSQELHACLLSPLARLCPSTLLKPSTKNTCIAVYSSDIRRSF